MLTINGHTTVSQLLETFPQTFDVLAAKGMCADCRNDPPPVPLTHFADKHCNGNIDGLLAELRSAAGCAQH